LLRNDVFLFINNYQLDDGKAFMENVYNAGKDIPVDEEEQKIVSEGIHDFLISSIKHQQKIG
jgi:hypothetical protein